MKRNKLRLPNDLIFHKNIGIVSQTTGEAKDLFKSIKNEMGKKSMKDFWEFNTETWEPLISNVAGLPVTITISKNNHGTANS